MRRAQSDKIRHLKTRARENAARDQILTESTDANARPSLPALDAAISERARQGERSVHLAGDVAEAARMLGWDGFAVIGLTDPARHDGRLRHSRRCDRPLRPRRKSNPQCQQPDTVLGVRCCRSSLFSSRVLPYAFRARDGPFRTGSARLR